MSLKKEIRQIPGPALRLALISMLLCGLLFPLAVTGVAQIFLRDQANGSIAHFSSNNSTAVGSYLIAQSFSQPFFFHPRNETAIVDNTNVTLSASGADPDITLQDALSQVPRISLFTGISRLELTALVNQNVEGTFWIFGSPYVNVLHLNLALIQHFQSVYCPKGYC